MEKDRKCIWAERHGPDLNKRDIPTEKKNRLQQGVHHCAGDFRDAIGYQPNNLLTPPAKYVYMENSLQWTMKKNSINSKKKDLNKLIELSTASSVVLEAICQV